MKRLASGSLVAVWLLLSAALWVARAQETSAALASTTSSSTQHLTVDDVIKLTQAGLSEDVLVTKIKKNGQAFDLSPDQMLQLKSNKVSDKVIQYMLDPTKAEPAETGAAGKPSDSPWPDEAGVYWRRSGETAWNELLPEVVYWKTGGVMKSIASYGVVKQDVNGHIEGKSSKTQTTSSAEFLIVAPEGIAITEYELLRLRQNGDNREFRTKTGGVFHASSGATRDVVDFENKKVASRRYVVSIPKLQKGEYGFLAPGAVASQNAAGSAGKIYSFSVAE